MHVCLPISKKTLLFSTDMSAGQTAAGNNISLSVDTENESESKRIFNAHANDGKITMPMEKTFWGSQLGMLADKFGIN